MTVDEENVNDHVDLDDEYDSYGMRLRMNTTMILTQGVD